LRHRRGSDAARSRPALNLTASRERAAAFHGDDAAGLAAGETSAASRWLAAPSDSLRALRYLGGGAGASTTAALGDAPLLPRRALRCIAHHRYPTSPGL